MPTYIERKKGHSIELQQLQLLLAINQLGRAASEAEAAAFMDIPDKNDFKRKASRLVAGGYLIRQSGKGECYYDITKKGVDYLLSLDERTLTDAYEDICFMVEEAKAGERLHAHRNRQPEDDEVYDYTLI